MSVRHLGSLATPGGAARPVFFGAYLSANLTTLSDEVDTAVVFNVADPSGTGMLNPATGVLTPPAGLICAQIRLSLSDLRSEENAFLRVYKNGTLLQSAPHFTTVNGSVSMSDTLLDICSGSDSYQVFYNADVRSTSVMSADATQTFVRGFVT